MSKRKSDEGGLNRHQPKKESLSVHSKSFVGHGHISKHKKEDGGCSAFGGVSNPWNNTDPFKIQKKDYREQSAGHQWDDTEPLGIQVYGRHSAWRGVSNPWIRNNADPFKIQNKDYREQSAGHQWDDTEPLGIQVHGRHSAWRGVSNPWIRNNTDPFKIQNKDYRGHSVWSGASYQWNNTGHFGMQKKDSCQPALRLENKSYSVWGGDGHELYNMPHFEIHKKKDSKASLLQLLSGELVPSFDSRILVVGAFGAGKTTLVANLIGKKVPRKRQSTDGIDVYFGKLMFDLKTRKLLQNTKGCHSFPKATYQKVLSYIKSIEKDVALQELGACSKKTHTDILDDEVLQKLSNSMDKYGISKELRNREVIPIPVLDFAGQIVYHTTHQTFITSHGIYLITFDGSRNLDDPLVAKGEGRMITILDNIRQWVSSILMYSHPDSKIYPRLMFVATHKDVVNQDDIPTRRSQLLDSLSSCFTDEKVKSHLMLQKVFFINATDNEDPEMEELKKSLSKTITKNPQWKQKVPKQFLILEMMLAMLVEEGKCIISHEDVEQINTQMGVKPLSEAELELFLRVQNICGKMTYIEYPNLRNFIVINPTCLIDILRSIVTSMPANTSLHLGRLTKADLAKIWSGENYAYFLQHEEYFRHLLVHYDILSEMKRYDEESGKKISDDCYLVPCMIKNRNETTFVERHLTSSKCVGFVFEFNALNVPDAIPSRLIASIISIWNIRRYENVELLFPGFVAVALDRKHDLVVKTEHNTVAVYIVHKERKELIIKDLASSVRQCLEQNLARISEVYSFSFSREITTKKYVPFEVKIKHGCLSQDCVLVVEEIGEAETEWICDNHGYTTPKSELDIWFTNRTVFQCTDSCQGILDAVMSMLPNDAQLLRISNSLTKEEVRSLAVNLGISNPELDAIDTDSSSMLKFYCLRICREKNKSCKDFVKAMGAAEINEHTMCQILRQAEVLTELPDKILNLPPSDEMLDKLCLRIGKEWMVLGLELDLEIERLEQIEYETVKVLREVSRQMLYCWRNRDDNATIRELLHALARSGRNPHLITEILENCDSYPNIIPVD